MTPPVLNINKPNTDFVTTPPGEVILVPISSFLSFILSVTRGIDLLLKRNR